GGGGGGGGGWPPGPAGCGPAGGDRLAGPGGESAAGDGLPCGRSPRPAGRAPAVRPPRAPPPPPAARPPRRRDLPCSRGAWQERSAYPRRVPPALAVHALEKLYGSVHALQGVDLAVGEGGLVGQLGPKGAGKAAHGWSSFGT